MLKKENGATSYTVLQMSKEQLYFMCENGVNPIVHAGTDEPYYAEELAQAIYSKEIKALEKWTSQQKGKKPILTEQQKEQITEWKKMEISNREIAKRLQVSEGTIRNFLKGF